MNLVKDFVLTRDADEKEILWSFHFGSCSDFQTALTMVKRIPFADRTYSPDKDHTWTVVPSSEAEGLLCAAFDNLKSCLLTTRAQLRLF